MKSRPIGVFDSGVGGLSILIELEKLLPNEKFVFIADQKYVPYGAKTPEELIDRATGISSYLLSRHKTKAIVVACNTATCYAIGSVREIYPEVPFIGTEPAVKPAAEKFKTIAVMSTPATARSQALARLVNDYANGSATCVGCPGLEEAVEEGDLDSPKLNKLLRHYVGLALKDGAQAIVLGCTHYPFLKKLIQNAAGSGVELFDSGEAVARRTAEVLSNRELLCGGSRKKKTLFFTTGDPGKFSYAAACLMGRPVISGQINI